MRKKCTALKCYCLIYDLCLQKKPVYILPSLVFELVCIIFSMIFNIFVSYLIVVSVGSKGLIYITIAIFMTGKDRVRIL